ncbi:hypothetical protein [Mycoplasma todarodis]|uniref:Uncharacterized protein n=1 Tax=Mycoplasma todarodis TaxID=1937191 RepID=A0A4R0XY26_9MOLU|nr:hypothetical protein [Mycoplasma todarodis]TCG11958.1 hypothetical protein C4B25_00440 [Mycoplasma todarodis]
MKKNYNQKYEEYESLFKKSKLNEINETELGHRWLKIRSFSRKQNLMALIQNIKRIEVKKGIRQRELAQLIFSSDISQNEIDDFIEKQFNKGIDLNDWTLEKLKEDLGRLESYQWSGIFDNNLDKDIVNNFVKKDSSFSKFESHFVEIQEKAKNYAISSWYNNWTTIFIENIFNTQPIITPAIGRIKSIDFFVDKTPYDLKVTMLPNKFVNEKRREKGLKSEESILRKWNKHNNNLVDITNLKSLQVVQLIWDKILISDNNQKRTEIMNDILNFREKLAKEVSMDPSELMQWLYEEQGAGRFDASNRFFLILINEENPWESWKLKAQFDLLNSKVTDYFASDNVEYVINFNWEGATHKVKSRLLIIKK